MTRRQAGIPRVNLPTRATRRRDSNFYCRSMRASGPNECIDSYGNIYRWIKGGLVHVGLRP